MEAFWQDVRYSLRMLRLVPLWRLLDAKCQKPEQAENAFRKYVDSLMDLLLSHQGWLHLNVRILYSLLLNNFIPLQQK